MDAAAWQRPPQARCEAFAAELRRRGVLATLRQSAAQDVDGGCGQLRARAVASAGEVRPVVRVHARPAAPVVS